MLQGQCQRKQKTLRCGLTLTNLELVAVKTMRISVVAARRLMDWRTGRVRCRGKNITMRPDPLRELWDRDRHAVYDELVRSLTTADGRIEVLRTLASIKISQEESRNADKLANYSWWLASRPLY